MPSNPDRDPRVALRRRLLAVAIGGISVVALAACWALAELPAEPVPALVVGAGEAGPTGVPARGPGAWTVTLWQPFADAPVVVVQAPPPAPFSLKLLSIMRRGGVATAVLDGKERGLVYAKEGTVIDGFTISGIDDAGIAVSRDGHKQRLDLER